MITSVEEYNKYLFQIQNENRPDPTFRLPSYEKIYEIDLNKRTGECPSPLAVQYDHNAETVWFMVDRYFDNVDLAGTVCVIQYLNARNEGGFYFVPYYDIQTAENKIIFPWSIERFLTQYIGRVQFAIRFYNISETLVDDKYVFEFNLNTKPITSQITAGIGVEDDLSLNDKYEFDANVLADIYQRILALKQTDDIFWIDLEESGEGS